MEDSAHFRIAVVFPTRVFVASLAVLAGLGAVWWGTLATLAGRWQEPQYSHGWLVPVLAAAVLRSRRSAVDWRAAAPAWSGAGVILLAAALQALGRRWFVEPLESASLLVAAAGACLVFGGTPLLKGALPAVALLVFLLPLPYAWETGLSLALQQAATRGSVFLLQTAGCAASAEGNLLIVDGVRLGVEDACSGLRMLTVLMAVAASVAAVGRRPAWQKATLLLTAAPLAVLVNVLRIAGTALACRGGDERLAEVCHDAAGWLMPAAALGLVWCELRLLDMFRDVQPPGRGEELLPSTDSKRVGVCSAAVNRSECSHHAPRDVRRNARLSIAPLVTRSVTATWIHNLSANGRILWTTAGLLIGIALAQQCLIPASAQSASDAGPIPLDALPATLGEWTAGPEQLDPQALRIAGATSSLVRRYTHGVTGRVFTVILLCGPPGPIAAHPPTTCYRGLGYALRGEPEVLKVPDDDREHAGRPADSTGAFDEFRVAEFAPPKESGSPHVRTAWAWSTDGRWSSPEHPRLTFAGAPRLFKLYVSAEVEPGAGSDEAGVREFTAILADALRRSVFTGL